MAVIDLTKDFTGGRFEPTFRREEIPLRSAKTEYTGIVYTITCDGMTGSYIDFPGHIAETDDGVCAKNCPLESVYRVPAHVVHLTKRSGDGPVSGRELAAACRASGPAEALIINALEPPLDFSDVEERSVYLDDSAVTWITERGYKMLVSDIYESKALEGVFLKLFSAGVKTVCRPVGLWKIASPQVRLTVLFSKMPGVMQVPCRVVAEE
jgi:kynurenine formamidase